MKSNQKIDSALSADAVSSNGISSHLSGEDLKVLKSAFPKNRLGVKVQVLNRDRTRAMLVLYLQHTDVQDRLEQVDPAWSCEVIHEERSGDTVYVRSRMTLKGVTRENVGEGNDPKAAYSDALKRCAMLFGVGRYLYDAPTVWASYDESKDRYRQWSAEDYEAAIKQSAGTGANAASSANHAQAPGPQPTMGTGRVIAGKNRTAASGTSAAQAS